MFIPQSRRSIRGNLPGRTDCAKWRMCINFMEYLSCHLDTTSALQHNSGMKRPLLFGTMVLVALATLTRFAPACGDPPAQGDAGTKAQLVIQGPGGIVRIGEPIFPNLTLWNHNYPLAL